jgi:hypothetical protein
MSLKDNTTYKITQKNTNQHIANVRIMDGLTSVQWFGDTEWEDDPDALGLVVFPEEFGFYADQL